MGGAESGYGKIISLTRLVHLKRISRFFIEEGRPHPNHQPDIGLAGLLTKERGLFCFKIIFKL